MQIRYQIFLLVIICSVLLGFVHAETGEELFEIGNANFQKSKFTEAIQVWERSITADPTLEANARYNIGLAYAGMEQYEEAIKSWDITIRLAPESPIAYDNKGTALAILGRNEEALAAYEKAIKLAPDESKYKADRDMLLNVMKTGKTPLSIITPLMALLLAGCSLVLRRRKD
jgi:tetratricopeptide (TPR) repeat protein